MFDHQPCLNGSFAGFRAFALFGVSTALSSTSPELLVARMDGAGIDFKAHDIWLVGCLLVHMLTGLEPFDASAIGKQVILHGGQIYGLHEMRQALIKRHTDWVCCQSSLSCSFVCICGHDRPIVPGIPRWLPASPAEAKALPHEGASALVFVLLFCIFTSSCC